MRAFTYTSKKSAKTIKSFPTVEIVAAAVIAFKQNNAKIERNEYPGDANCKQSVSNKTLALNLLTNHPSQTEWDCAIEEAREVISWIQGMVTMGILGNKKITSFTMDIAKCLEEETVPEFKVGLLVYAPNLYQQGKKREEIVEKTVEVMYSSEALGKEGDKVTVNFTLIEYRYVQQYNFFSAFGKDDKGNLVSFITQKEELCRSMLLTGKVKKAGPDAYHQNAVVTQLNFVKAPK